MPDNSLPTELPKILTVADWKIKKGVIATLVSETGLTEGLTRLKTVFDKLTWKRLDPATVTANPDNQPADLVAALKSAHEQARHRYPLLRQAQAYAVGFGTLANKSARELSANKLVPAATIKHVRAMAAAAKALGARLDPKFIDRHWFAAIQRASPTTLRGVQPKAVAPPTTTAPPKPTARPSKRKKPSL